MDRIGVMHKAHIAVKRVCEAWTDKSQAESQARLIVLSLAENDLLKNAKIAHGLVLEETE